LEQAIALRTAIVILSEDLSEASAVPDSAKGTSAPGKFFYIMVSADQRAPSCYPRFLINNTSYPAYEKQH
jgi:hypothetical protein